MLALEPTVVDAIWQSFAAYLPKRGHTTHPLGCHRPRISDRDCFEAILFRLVTGCSWDVAGRATSKPSAVDQWTVPTCGPPEAH
jgi:transposase